MAPLALVLSLAAALSAQELKMPTKGTTSFSRACKAYAPDKLTDKSEGLVRKIVESYLGPPGQYFLQHDDNPNASPEVGEFYPGATKVVVKWTPGIFYENYTHNDLNQVKCMLAHEAAHVQLVHPISDRALLDRKAAQLLTPEVRAGVDKKMAEFDTCQPLGGGKFSGFQCNQLYQVLLQEPIRKDAEFVAIRRKHELEADVKAVHMVADVKVDGKAGDPWACWSMLMSMPEPPPAKKDEPPDVHPANAERARAVFAELKSMGLPDPCL